MIKCDSVSFGAPVEIKPRDPQREATGSSLVPIWYDEKTGALYCEGSIAAVVVVPPPGSVIRLQGHVGDFFDVAPPPAPKKPLPSGPGLREQHETMSQRLGDPPPAIPSRRDNTPGQWNKAPGPQPTNKRR
jgi:hypothetical protein